MKKTSKIGVAAMLTTAAIGSIAYATVSRIDSQPETAVAVQKPKALPLLDERSVKPAEVARIEQRTVANPGSADAWNQLGLASMQVSDYDKTIDAYRKSLAIDPAQGEAWSALGEAYARSVRSTTSKMPSAARTAFDKALALNPNDIRAHFYIALEKDYNGQHDAANADWLHLLTLVPAGSGPDKAIRAAMIDSLNRNIRVLSQAVATVQQPAKEQLGAVPQATISESHLAAKPTTPS